MPKTLKPATTPPSSATKKDEIVRVRDVERDPGSILRRAAVAPVRISAKDGAALFHIATIRRGDESDPAWAGALPVALAALSRRAGRILHLACGLQIALRVQARANSRDVYFIEPGHDCLEFAARRLGLPSRDAALLRNALRRSQFTRGATETAVKRADLRRLDEVKSLHGQIAALERAADKHGEVAEALKTSEAALRKARLDLKAVDATARTSASDRDREVQTLKSRIATLERDLKRQTATRDPNKGAIIRKPRPEPETPPSDSVESGSPATSSIAAA